jgi:predicted AAA+ superfamily ATPase
MYIQRTLEKKILRFLRAPEIIAVVGARQSGKTTLLEHVASRLARTNFLTFEDGQVRELFARDIKAFIALHVAPYRHVFLDEFHYARDGGKSLKLIHDTVKGRKIFISGSSVPELSVRAVKHLAGRILVFTLYPLAFEEFLGHADPGLSRWLIKAGRGGKKLDPVIVERLNDVVDEMAVFGGFPRVALSATREEKREILRNLLNIYLLRDVRDVLRLADDYKMLALLKALALQAGGFVAYQDLSIVTGLDHVTLRKYLNILEKTFVVRLVRPFFSNRRTEIVKNPKVYFLDAGLRNAVLSDFRRPADRPDGGALLEGFVFSQVVKQDREIATWRSKSGAEVDFVVDGGLPVEVKSRLGGPAVEKSLRSFIERYGPKRAFVLSRDLFGRRAVGGCSVAFTYHFADV